MLERPWTKKKKLNYRVEVEATGYNSRTFTKEAICGQIENDLNDLFRSHTDFKNYSANVNYDEVLVCQFCEEHYEEIYEPSMGTEFNGVCVNCGKGSREAMIEKLKDKKDEH